VNPPKSLATMKQWFDERFPLDWDIVRDFGSEPVPYHLRRWWWCLGGTPAYLFLVMAVTGVLMTFYYVPEPQHAYDSVQKITEQVPFGWYFRSLHRWAANLMIIAVALHVMRGFFTGAFRTPREFTWMTGCGLLFVVLSFGFTGYSLVYEQLSYWGQTVAANLTETVPIIGPHMARLMRGGETVGDNTLTRLYVMHIALLPCAITGLLFLHFMLIRLHGVTPDRFEGEPEGKTYPFFPDHFLTELIIGVGVIFVLTCLACIFPAQMGPRANPLVTPEHIKPEWYFFFTFRWLKLTGLTFAVLSLGFGGFLLVVWPFVDAAIRKVRPNSEASVYIGILGFLALLGLTLWEVLAMH